MLKDIVNFAQEPQLNAPSHGPRPSATEGGWRERRRQREEEREKKRREGEKEKCRLDEREYVKRRSIWE
jgi:hypothetical protein